jgi:hypothetical protein
MRLRVSHETLFHHLLNHPGNREAFYGWWGGEGG